MMRRKKRQPMLKKTKTKMAKPKMQMKKKKTNKDRTKMPMKKMVQKAEMTKMPLMTKKTAASKYTSSRSTSHRREHSRFDASSKSCRRFLMKRRTSSYVLWSNSATTWPACARAVVESWGSSLSFKAQSTIQHTAKARY